MNCHCVQSDPNQDTNKTDDLIKWLLNAVKDNILFSNLNDNQRRVVVDQMYKMPIAAEEVLIQQGEEGNTFYHAVVAIPK